MKNYAWENKEKNISRKRKIFGELKKDKKVFLRDIFPMKVRWGKKSQQCYVNEKSIKIFPKEVWKHIEGSILLNSFLFEWVRKEKYFGK